MGRYVANVDVERLGIGPGDGVLDVGCGEGYLARELARAGYRATGVEPDAVLRARFDAAARELAEGSCTVVAASAEDMPFPDGHWRVAIMTEVLEHVQDPRKVLRELNRVLGPGGRLCVSVPTSLTERLYARLHPRYAENATHVRVLRRDELAELLRASGFAVVHVEGKNFIPAVSWVFHALLRSDADHTGAIGQHLWVDKALGVLWWPIHRARLMRVFLAVGDRIFPKSLYVYAEKIAPA
jgi:2-polyprenyl-3-methyl-5-hydroxy-6-metoxy-1,4-benzoquinol methylase